MIQVLLNCKSLPVNKFSALFEKAGKHSKTVKTGDDNRKQ